MRGGKAARAGPLDPGPVRGARGGGPVRPGPLPTPARWGRSALLGGVLRQLLELDPARRLSAAALLAALSQAQVRPAPPPPRRGARGSAAPHERARA